MTYTVGETRMSSTPNRRSLRLLRRRLAKEKLQNIQASRVSLDEIELYNTFKTEVTLNHLCNRM